MASFKVHELHTTIYDILENALCKQVDNKGNILAYLFHSASRQHHEVWTSLFPFLHNFKDTVPPNESYLYWHII